MKNKDILQKFLFENVPVRGVFSHLDKTYQTIISQHDYSPVLRQFLGEALVLVSLLSATIKFAGRLTIQFQGSGNLKLLLVQANQNFHLRGLIQVSQELQTHDELLAELKQGVLVITMDPDDSTQRYQGIVAWKGNSLKESIEGYFRDSEQLLTRIWLAVDKTRACGMLIQSMPETRKLETKFTAMPSDHPDWEHILHLTSTIKANELLNLDNPTILHRLYNQEDVRLFEPAPVIFRCTCSLKRGENAILMLGRKEAEEELHDKQKIVVTCEFCGSEFSFDRVDVEMIFRRGDDLPSSSSLQ
jgi:molecular chaperone Hsp33